MNKKAFTLVELIVTIAILAILWTIAFISLQWYSEQSRDAVRISDVSTIKSWLELYELEAGKYPEPTNGVNITYSWSIVWSQWVYGETLKTNISKIDRLPLDPLTEKEYTYSVSWNRNEYELWWIIEWDEIVLNPSQPSLKLGKGKLQANAWETTTKAMVLWSYNWKMIKTLSWTICDILSLPTIVTNDTSTWTDLLEIINNKSLVFNWYENLPSSFKTSKFKYDWWFEFTPNKLVAYTDNLWCNTLSESENNRITMLKNLQENYSGTILETNENYKELVNTDINLFAPNNASKLISRALVSNNLKQTLSESSLTFLNCEWWTENGYTYGNIAHGLWESVTKTVNISNGINSYGALAVCNNWNIQISNENINTNCTTNGYVEQAWACVQDICGNTVPSNAHSTATSQSVSTNWLHNTTPWLCTFTCDTNYSWNGTSCTADTQTTNCTSLPTDAHWNTANNITQTWNGTTWLPIEIWEFNVTSSTSTCNFICNLNYTWNGSSCVANTQSANCGWSIPNNATASTATTYTQTWDWNAWTPSTNWWETQATCDYNCDSWYTWNGTICDANMLTVTFDGNGGSGHTPTSKSVTYNTAVWTLPSNPTKAWYTFTWWYTLTSGWTQITTGTTITTDTTYYAQWSINDYTVTFDGNWGTGHTPTSKSVTYNTAVWTLASNPTRAWYTFNGWYTQTSGWTQISTWTTITTDTTFYSQWLQNWVCWSTDWTSQTNVPSTNLCSVWTSSSVTIAAWSYTWTCSSTWATTANCSATRQYIVTFDENGGWTPSPTTKNVDYNTAVWVLSTVFKTGYTFDGWFTLISGWTLITTATNVIDNITYYAHWTINNYTVSWSFWAAWASATINVCGTNVFADDAGNFTTTRNYGSTCNTITATKTNYTCTTTTQWPASLVANTTNIAWNCVANTQTYTCPAKPANSSWNTVWSYTQTWNGSAWLPANSTTSYNISASTTECRYTCDSWYFNNGWTSCDSQWSWNTTTGYLFKNTSWVEQYPLNCNDLIDKSTWKNTLAWSPWNGSVFSSWVYWIKPNASAAFKVYCDMTNSSGWWTLLSNVVSYDWTNVYNAWTACTSTSTNCGWDLAKLWNSTLDYTKVKIVHQNWKYVIFNLKNGWNFENMFLWTVYGGSSDAAYIYEDNLFSRAWYTDTLIYWWANTSNNSMWLANTSYGVNNWATYWFKWNWNCPSAVWYSTTTSACVSSWWYSIFVKKETETSLWSISSFPGKSCKAIKDAWYSTWNWVYWIKPDANAAFQVYCDMTTDWGGWTLVRKMQYNVLVWTNTAANNASSLTSLTTASANLADTTWNALNPTQVWNICNGYQTIYNRNTAVSWYSNHWVTDTCWYNTNFYTNMQRTFWATALTWFTYQACWWALYTTSGSWWILTWIHASSTLYFGCYDAQNAASTTSAASAAYDNRSWTAIWWWGNWYQLVR